MRNKPLFILGCGPSLAECDVSRLSNCYTMAMKRAFLSFKDWGFDPTYYVSLDTVANVSNKQAIKTLIKKSKIKGFFFPKHESSRFYSRRTRFVEIKSNCSDVNLDFKNVLHVANTGLFALQIAIGLLHFRKIYLLGCDANYEDKQTHYRKDYWKNIEHNPPGIKFHYPAWLLFYERYIKNNDRLEVFNCAKKGKLQFLPFCDFNRLDIKDAEINSGKSRRAYTRPSRKTGAKPSLP